MIDFTNESNLLQRKCYNIAHKIVHLNFKLVHGVVFSSSFKSSVSREVLLVLVSNVGACLQPDSVMNNLKSGLIVMRDFIKLDQSIMQLLTIS